MSIAHINAHAAAEDIQSGMEDKALMEKYHISERQLASLFQKLVEKGLLKQSELDARVGLSEKTLDMSWKCPKCGSPRDRAYDVCPDCGVIVAKFLNKPLKEEEKPNASGGLIESQVRVSETEGHPQEHSEKNKNQENNPNDEDVRHEDSVSEPDGHLRLEQLLKISRIFFGIMFAWCFAGLLTNTWFWFVGWLVIFTAISVSVVTYTGKPKLSQLALMGVILLFLNTGVSMYRTPSSTGTSPIPASGSSEKGRLVEQPSERSAMQSAPQSKLERSLVENCYRECCLNWVRSPSCLDDYSGSRCRPLESCQRCRQCCDTYMGTLQYYGIGRISSKKVPRKIGNMELGMTLRDFNTRVIQAYCKKAEWRDRCGYLPWDIKAHVALIDGTDLLVGSLSGVTCITGEPMSGKTTPSTMVGYKSRESDAERELVRFNNIAIKGIPADTCEDFLQDSCKSFAVFSNDELFLVSMRWGSEKGGRKIYTRVRDALLELLGQDDNGTLWLSIHQGLNSFFTDGQTGIIIELEARVSHFFDSGWR
jgi:hypothetical protein